MPGWFGLYFPIRVYEPTNPGCVSQGKTLEKALVNIREAVQLCPEVQKRERLPLTVQTFEIREKVSGSDFGIERRNKRELEKRPSPCLKSRFLLQKGIFCYIFEYGT